MIKKNQEGGIHRPLIQMNRQETEERERQELILICLSV